MSTVFKHRPTPTQLDAILADHTRHLAGEDGPFRAIFENEDLCGREFNERSMPRVTFHNCDLELAKFLGCDLAGVLFEKCSFYRSPFRACNLTNVVFRDCVIKHSWMTRCNFAGVQTPGTKFTRCDLRYSQIQTADFSLAEMRGVDFAGCEWGENRLTCKIQLEIKVGKKYPLSVPEEHVDDAPLPGARIEA